MCIFVPCSSAIHAWLASKEDTTFYLLNFPLANYHLEMGIIEQTLTSRSMRSNGVDSPLMLKGCGRPARGNGGLRRPCVYTPAAFSASERKVL